MNDPKSAEQATDKDRLVSRPDEPLPTVEEPSGAHAKGFPADPKPDPEARPAEDDLERSA